MNYKILIRLTFCLGLIILGCNEDDYVSKDNISRIELTPTLQEDAPINGATQISGLGVFADQDECNAVDADFALSVTGDLEGCLYIFVDAFDCSPSGTYRETGREYFVGTYNEEAGTFLTEYRFEARYEDCNDVGPLGLEIFGRCQHPIVPGSGTGVFEGVTGRLDFKDDIEAGNFPYRGHLRY